MLARATTALLRSLLVLGALAASAAAQTLYSVDGPAGTFDQSTGPPAGPCAYPTGPIVSSLPFPAPSPCPPTALPFPPPPAPMGDIAVNRAADVIYVTDGVVVSSYTPAGALVSNFPAGVAPLGPLTGMGFDGAAGILWITDGIFAMGVFPPPAPGCVLPVLAVPPFPLPFLAATGPYTDIDWDASTGSLLLCSTLGFVVSIFPGGAPGPFGMFPVVPGICPLGLPLTGIAVDASAPPGAGFFFVGSAGLTAYLMPGGAPAPLTFYRTVTCAPSFLPPSSGLAFAARPISYGAGGGVPLPVIGSIGQSVTPNPGFAITLTGAAPLAPALLYLGAAPACPAFVLPPPVLLALLPPPTLFFFGFTSPAGALVAPAPLPPAMVPPIAAYLQWFVLAGAGITSSAGLELSIALP